MHTPHIYFYGDCSEPLCLCPRKTLSHFQGLAFIDRFIFITAFGSLAPCALTVVILTAAVAVIFCSIFVSAFSAVTTMRRVTFRLNFTIFQICPRCCYRLIKQHVFLGFKTSSYSNYFIRCMVSFLICIAFVRFDVHSFGSGTPQNLCKTEAPQKSVTDCSRQYFHLFKCNC